MTIQNQRGVERQISALGELRMSIKTRQSRNEVKIFFFKFVMHMTWLRGSPYLEALDPDFFPMLCDDNLTARALLIRQSYSTLSKKIF